MCNKYNITFQLLQLYPATIKTFTWTIISFIYIHWTGCMHFLIPVFTKRIFNTSLRKSWIYASKVTADESNASLGTIINCWFRSISFVLCKVFNLKKFIIFIQSFCSNWAWIYMCSNCFRNIYDNIYDSHDNNIFWHNVR